MFGLPRIIMHETTYYYIRDNISTMDFSHKIFYNGFGDFLGYDLVIDNNLSPTINEPHMEWVFPKNDFYSYGPEDEDWCRFFKIGYMGRGLIIGDILILGDRNSSTPEIKVEALKQMRKSYQMTPKGPKRI